MTTANSKLRPPASQLTMPARHIDNPAPLQSDAAPRATFGPAIVYRQGIRVTGVPPKRLGSRR